MPLRKLAFFFLFAIDILGCSKANQSTSTAPVSTITALSVSCSSAAILSSQTASCTATVQGTGAYNSGVSWSAIGGTVSSTGVVTPSGAGTIAVTATSNQDTSKAASTNVLSVAPATLASVSPVVVSAGPTNLLSVTGSGYSASSQIQIDGIAVATNFVSSNQLTANLNFQSALSHKVTVVNVSPVASTSASISLPVLLPVLTSLSAVAATPGTDVTLGVSGMDTSAASKNILRFTQGSVTFDTPASNLAPNGTDANGLHAAILTASVPSTMAPTSRNAALGVPATVSMIVDGVNAAGTAPLLVEPPLHGLQLVPDSAAPGSVVQVIGLGAFTHFDSSTVFTSDVGLTLSNPQINSGTQFAGTLTVDPAAVTGGHTLTVTTGSETVKLPFTVVLASPSAPVLTSLSVGSGTPMTPIVLTGSGFSGLGQAASSFALQYVYGANLFSVPAIPNSDTQVSTYIPPLYDPSSGAPYTGPLALSVLVNGQASAKLPLTLIAPPANGSAIGTSTLAYLDAYKQMLNNANAQAATNPAFTVTEIGSMVSVNNATLNSLASLRAAVVSASANGSATLSDGTVITQGAINTFDVFLQQSAVQQLAPHLQKGSLQAYEAVLHPLAVFSFTDNSEKDAATACKVSDAFGLATSIFSGLSSASCLLAFITPLAPVCAVSKTISEFATIASDLASLTCDALPVNMRSVKTLPSAVIEPISASATLEAPTGTFGQSPALIANAATDVASLIVDNLGDKVESYFERVTPSLVANGKVYVDTLFDALTAKIEDEIGVAANSSLTSSLGYSQQVNLTSNTTALLPSLGGQVVTNGLSFSPGTKDGIATLALDLSSFRLIDSNGNTYSDGTLVPGNLIPVTIESVVAISPATATITAGAQQQFSANVAGTSNQAVTWSVDNVSSGNATLGTISTNGLYTAPGTLGNHVISAVSQLDGQTGTAQVQIAGGPLSALAVSPNPVLGGTASTGILTLTSAAPSGGTIVGLSSSDITLATVPASVTVPYGATSATFVINTLSVTANHTVTIGASFGSDYVSASLTVSNVSPAKEYLFAAFSSPSHTGDIAGFKINTSTGALAPMSSIFSTPSLITSLASDPKGAFLAAGTSTTQGYEIISPFAVDGSGNLTATGGSSVVGANGGTNYVAFGPDGNHVYETFKVNGPGISSAASLNRATGSLTITSGYSAGGGNPMAVSPTGTYLLASDSGLNYGTTRSLVYYALSATGDIMYYGWDNIATDADPEGIVIDTSGTFAYVANAGAAEISGYRIDSKGTGTPLPGSPYSTGVTPRSVVMAPSGKYLIVSEDSGNIRVFSRDTSTGVLLLAPTMAFPATKDPSSGLYPFSYLAIDGTGNFVYLTTSSNAKVYGYSLDTSAGVLSSVPGSPYSVGGETSGTAVTSLAQP